MRPFPERSFPIADAATRRFPQPRRASVALLFEPVSRTTFDATVPQQRTHPSMRVRTLLLPLLLPSAAVLTLTGCASTGAGSSAETGESTTDASAARATTVEVVASQPVATPTGLTTEASFASAVGQDTDDFIESAERRAERSRLLVQEFLAEGDTAYDKAQLDLALVAYSKALELEPGNVAAQDGLRKVRSTMGDPLIEAADMLDDQQNIVIVRRQLARLEAEEALIDGDNAMRLGQYDEALRHFERARNIIAVQPLIQNNDLDLQIVQRRVELALDAQDEQAIIDARLRTEDAERDRLEAEREAAEYRERKLGKWYADAHQAFLSDDYTRAQSLAELILTYDPGNQAAEEMREIATIAQLNKRDSDLQREYREAWIRTMEDLEYSDVPQTDPVTFDPERWRDIVAPRTPHGFTGTDVGADPERARVSQTLRNVRVPGQFGDGEEGAPLVNVARFLSQNTGINFLLSAEVKDLDEEDTAVNLSVGNRSVYEVLELIAATSEEVRWTIADGTVKFVTLDEETGIYGLKTYEVRDLIRAPRDFPGPEINVLPSEGIEYVEDDELDIEATVLTGDELVGLIEENVSPDSWDNGSIELTETGVLTVYQTPEVHAQIDALLKDLQGLAGIMVDIQTRFLRVQDSFLEEIGVDFRGLGAPGLGNGGQFDDFGPTGTTADGLNDTIGLGNDQGIFFDEGNGETMAARIENLFDTTIGNDEITTAGGFSGSWTYLGDLQLQMLLRAVSKAERVEVVTAPRLLVFNGARASLQVLNQFAYVQDYNVEIATASSIADPVIQVIQDGVVLDVRPVVSADRRFVTLDLRPTVAVLTQPIESFITTLNVATTVEIQLPELEIQRLRTVASVPDGGTLLLGGLRLHTNQNNTAGVPILRNIPIVSLFFDRKANFIDNRKTLILLTANIVIPKELEPTEVELGPGR